MPLIHDEPLDFLSGNGCPSRCRVRVCTPPDETQESGYIVILTDDATACGTSVTNAAEQIGAEVAARYHLPPDRTQWIEHYDFRHTPSGHDGNGHEQTFARVRFGSPVTAGEIFDFVHNTSLGRPSWTHVDRDTVESMIGEPLP